MREAVCAIILLLVVLEPSFSDTSGFDLCDLEPLNPVLGYEDPDSELQFFWNLCEQRKGPISCNDTTTAICVFKTDPLTGNKTTIAENAGKRQNLQLKAESSGHFSLTLSGESLCQDDPTQKVSTRFDFFCNDNEDEQSPQKSVALSSNHGHPGFCHFNFFWSTSVACTSKQDTFTDSCIVDVPGFDQKLDLKALQEEKYFLVNSDDHQRHFQLNICGPVRNGTCPSGSPLCEVSDDSKLIKTLIPSVNSTMRASYERSNSSFTLKYNSQKFSSIVEIVCDSGANIPVASFLGADNSTLRFRVKTSRVCLFQPKPCIVKNGDKIYDLSSLSASTSDWIAYDLRSGFQSQKYYISVCKPLPPASLKHTCPGAQTSVCQAGKASKEFTALASSQSVSLHANSDDGSVILTYGDGAACNAKHNYSSQIIFRCNPTEKGPSLTEVTSDCVYIFTWPTPEACEKSKIVETGQICQIKDSRFGHVFDLGSLRNEDGDYVVNSSSGWEYAVNVCGAKVKSYSVKPSSVCGKNKDGRWQILGFSDTEKLSNFDGLITLDYEGEVCNVSKTNSSFHTKIVFQCDHKADASHPEVASEGPCNLRLLWKTKFACPPFDEIECTAQDKNGVYDLSSLSLPNNNYEIQTSGTTKYLLNVCRSIVKQVDYDCPYKSAVCSATINPTISQSWTYTNLGQVVSSPKFDEQGRLVIEYSLGSICKEDGTADTHLSTKIVFKCRKGDIETEPEFVEQVGCTSIFFWETDAACPVSDKTAGDVTTDDCKIFHPRSGHLFDLSKIHLSNNLEILDPQGNKITLNICAPIVGKGTNLSNCGSKSGSCLTDQSGRSYNLGNFNSRLSWSYGEELTLKYTTTGNETIIHFRCGPMRNETHLIFLERIESTTFVDVFTSLACDRTVFCEAKSAGKSQNLFSLMDYRQNVFSNIEDSTFFFSVCKPLAHVDGLDCPADAAICSARQDPTDGFINPISYGVAAAPPTFNSDGDVEIRYINGSKCQSNETFQSKIVFKCKEDVFPGTPSIDLQKSSSCRKVFTWETAAMCSKKLSTLDQGNDCKIFHALWNKTIDLADIQNTERKKDFVIETDDKIYYLQPCEKLSTKCNSAICMMYKDSNTNHSYIPLGPVSVVKNGFDENEIIVQYKSQSRCKGSATFSGEILFSCDPQSNGSHPFLASDLPCHPIFQWNTPVLCGRSGSTTAHYGHNLSHHEEKRSVLTGGVVFLMLALVIVFGSLLLMKPHHRERCRRRLSQLSNESLSWCARFRFRRSGDHQTLLETRVPAFGSINDDDDVDMILA